MTNTGFTSLQEISCAVIEGGNLTIPYFRADPARWEKSADNPVTVADLEVNAFLRERLGNLDPNAAWLSEETKDDFPARAEVSRLWIVDPLDGTKEFIEGVPDYTIVVAYVIDRLPICAAVYNPARQQLFTAVRGGGAWINGRRIHTSSKTALARARILVSRSDLRKGKWDGHPDLTFLGVGGCGYKMCLVAMGAAEASINLSKLHEWDVAAPSLVVQEAGGVALNRDLQNFVFNREIPYVGGQLSAGTAVLLERLHATVFTPA